MGFSMASFCSFFFGTVFFCFCKYLSFPPGIFFCVPVLSFLYSSQCSSLAYGRFLFFDFLEPGMGFSLSSFPPFFRLFFFQAEDGIRDCLLSRGLGDVYKRQPLLYKKKERKRHSKKSRERENSVSPFPPEKLSTGKKEKSY